MNDDPVLAGFIAFNAAPHFEERVNALRNALSEAKPGKIVDEAKALIECVFRTIITNARGNVRAGKRGAPTVLELYQQAKEVLALSEDTEVNDWLHEVCSKISQITGRTRNNHGASSHGRDSYESSTLGIPEAVFLARSSLALVALFISRHEVATSIEARQRLIYEDYEEFNNYLDANDDWPVIADRELRPSETLFKTDPEAYKAALIDYNRTKDEE